MRSTQVPDPSVVTLYLTEIAKAYGVDYTPRPQTIPQPISSTVGVPLPLPGQAVPSAISAADFAAPGGPPCSHPI